MLINNFVPKINPKRALKNALFLCLIGLNGKKLTKKQGRAIIKLYKRWRCVMWTVLDKANTIIQTLCIFYELYQFVKKYVVKTPKMYPVIGEKRQLQHT